MNKRNFKSFQKALRSRSEFDYVEVTRVDDFGNLLKSNGDVIGEENSRALTQLGKEHGFHILGRLSVWKDEETFKIYGPSTQ